MSLPIPVAKKDSPISQLPHTPVETPSKGNSHRTPIRVTSQAVNFAISHLLLIWVRGNIIINLSPWD